VRVGRCSGGMYAIWGCRPCGGRGARVRLSLTWRFGGAAATAAGGLDREREREGRDVTGAGNLPAFLELEPRPNQSNVVTGENQMSLWPFLWCLTARPKSSNRNPQMRMALNNENASRTRYCAWYVSVEKPSWMGVKSVWETKHSTLAVSESEDAKNAPSAIQNVPMRPKQPSSILVDTGFMLLLTLNADLDTTFQYSKRRCVEGYTYSTRMMARVADDTNIANGTKRVRSEALSTL
jgi:hypothetical protein